MFYIMTHIYSPYINSGLMRCRHYTGSSCRAEIGQTLRVADFHNDIAINFSLLTTDITNRVLVPPGNVTIIIFAYYVCKETFATAKLYA